MSIKQVSILDLKARKNVSKISMTTCYDSSFAKLVDASGGDTILVGDSLGNIMLGHDHTIPVTVDDMIHHCASVTRVCKRAFVIADLPFGSYTNRDQAVGNAVRLIQEGGAQAVKMEGGRHILPYVEAITALGIPVIGHLGLTPQSVHGLGGYKVQGRDSEVGQRMDEEARLLDRAGVAMLVLELVPSELAAHITKAVSVPTIGIGAGSATDGQVLVLQDLLGFDDSFKPKFLKNYAQLGQLIKGALNEYDQEVKESQFPTKDHSYE